MILIENFNQVTAQIESERGITRDELIAAIEQALVSACRRKFSEEALLEAKLNAETGEAKVFQIKKVVKTVENDMLEISQKEAKKLGGKLDEDVRIEVTPTDLGRIAAQTAKQVIIQRIREAEKNVIYNEFKGKIGQIITGTVQRIENKNYLINLGRAEAILAQREQLPGESFSLKDKVKLFLVDVERNSRGAFIHISRTHPGFLKKLFELEIPEIQDGIIEIKSVARDPGKRSKVAVKSNNPAIGAVGTCVGHMGGRIQSIIKELGYEKIDVLEWNEDAKQFIANALKPAKISQVIITDEANKTAAVIVPNDQLSLAIGKQGINVRLSVKLTNWKLDIFSEEEYKKQGVEITGKKSFLEKLQLEKEKIKQEESGAKTPEQELVESESPDGVKVSALAKELNLKTKELMDQAKELGIEIPSNRAVLLPEQVNAIREKINR
jgi:N utilization substance protein A